MNSENATNVAPVDGIVMAIERIGSLKPDDITEADIDAVEDLMGMGRRAWDMVDHRELILAAAKVIAGKSA